MVSLDGENYLNGNEACLMLGVKAATLYAYVSRGVLKSYKQGIKRHRLYKEAELEKLLQLRPSDESSPSTPDSGYKEKNPDEVNDQNAIPAAEDWIPYY